MGNLYLRPAESTDCHLLWEWANENEVRQNSFHTEFIPLLEHEIWFKSIMSDDSIKLYILQEDDEMIGQIRLTYIGKWQISYSIAVAFRNHGYAKIMLKMVENELIRSGHVGEHLWAEVKVSNIASRKIFEKLGYVAVASMHDDACAYQKQVQPTIYDIDEIVPTN